MVGAALELADVRGQPTVNINRLTHVNFLIFGISDKVYSAFSHGGPVNDDVELSDWVVSPRGSEISAERWERVRLEIDHVSLLETVLEKPIHGNLLNCPMGIHRDSTPSFTIYRQSNSSFCFGCPPPSKDQAYDNINFVSRYYSITRAEALKWLERRYKLPVLAGAEDSPVAAALEEDEVIELNFEDLREPFLALSTVLSKDTNTQDLLNIFFKAQQTLDPLPLAKVLGKDRVKRILRHKAYGRTNAG